jgi:hypothetical protein
LVLFWNYLQGGNSTDMFSDVCSGRLPGWIGKAGNKEPIGRPRQIALVHN